MKKHIIVLSLCPVFLLLGLIIYYLGYKYDEVTISPFNIFISVICIIWITLYPIAFYTCYRLVILDTKKGHILSSLLTFIDNDLVAMLIWPFIFPIIIAPLFIPDYVIFFRSDKRKIKF